MSNEQGSSKDIFGHPIVRKPETAQGQFFGMNELTSFEDLMEGQGTNVGCFTIVNTEFIPYLTFPNQNEPILNWLIEDKDGKLAYFTNYGEMAIKFQSLEVGQVVNIECFKWVEDTKHLAMGTVTFHKAKGISFESTDVQVHSVLTEAVGKKKIPDYRKPFTFDDVIKHNGKICLNYVNELPKIHRQTEKYEGFVKTLVFKTSDGVSVHITFFRENAEREFDMHFNDICIISGATIARMYRTTLELTGHGHTDIVVITGGDRPGKQKRLHPTKVTLGDLKKMTDEDKTSKFFKIKCVARCQPFMDKKGFTQMLVSDGSEMDNKMICAAFHSSGNIQIARGMTFSATVHIENQHGTPVLIAEPETVKEEKEKLDTTKMFSTATTRL